MYKNFTIDICENSKFSFFGIHENIRIFKQRYMIF